MNDKKTVILGKEYDQKLRDQLCSVLASFGAQIDKSSWGVGGSQELLEIDVSVSGTTLHIEAETYIGLSISGEIELVNKIDSLIKSSLTSGSS